MSTQTLPITGLAVGGVSPAVMVCGSPERALKASRYLDNPRTLARQREYHSYQGTYQDVVITITSHGVGAPGAAIAFEELIAGHPGGEIDYLQVPFNHPVYIMYSSGTTGKPKCMVHGVGGTLLKHLCEHQLMCDVKPDDRVFYFTT